MVWGILAATILTASLWRHNLRRPWGEVADPLSVVPDYLGLWAMALGLAALVAVPRYLHVRSSHRASPMATVAAGGGKRRV
jgi:hypothetical protein